MLQLVKLPTMKERINILQAQSLLEIHKFHESHFVPNPRDNLDNPSIDRCVGPFPTKFEKLEKNGIKDVLNELKHFLA
ncbi:hypothetical protein RO3G_02757 [Rhizopus delemar RA 99-880]|uniref:Uncharacterized protein n=1 Tax=Rhizopus delemar (strain RA 99-880 / ATCC MYA-4621 / FGSC 9543 / NRRL 43880) TaxID=246409 RepID=I1BPC3_RHIO9|nr:hypothetical protein RO3G_02757 [Rhizopus delemar RA 99-880]|eukprot:EIE78053.1 hypothetical protein RO3G_02757 [Rhizopus delemar RA 99-880]